MSKQTKIGICVGVRLLNEQAFRDTSADHVCSHKISVEVGVGKLSVFSFPNDIIIFFNFFSEKMFFSVFVGWYSLRYQ